MAAKAKQTVVRRRQEVTAPASITLGNILTSEPLIVVTQFLQILPRAASVLRLGQLLAMVIYTAARASSIACQQQAALGEGTASQGRGLSLGRGTALTPTQGPMGRPAHPPGAASGRKQGHSQVPARLTGAPSPSFHPPLQSLHHHVGEQFLLA